MDPDFDTLTLLLMDPFLTLDEAQREANATAARPAEPRQPVWRNAAETPLPFPLAHLHREPG